MSEGRQNSCSDNRLTGNQTETGANLMERHAVQMQDKLSYCPAPLGRGATPYIVQYSGVPSGVHL